MKAVLVTITGKVQGVGFRYAARAKAREFEVAGWITNKADGSVQAFAQGDDNAVDSFANWMRTGPAGAGVTGYEISDETADDGLSGFAAR